MQLSTIFRSKASALAVAATCLLANSAQPAVAREQCFTIGAAQFMNALHYCTSTTLSSQSGNSYGPANLADGDSRTAWCEGVPGPGLGETITLHIDGGSSFQRLLIGNGYGKSNKSYRQNNRPRMIEISTDSTPPTRLELLDQNSPVPVPLMGSREYKWVQIKILSVYRGDTYDDTCVDFVTPDFEYDEMLLQQSQGY